MKKLTKEAVCEIAETLIQKNGSTTTLDVKNHLRTRGYEAFQNDVSRFMQDLTTEESWNFRNNGRYKVYSFGNDTRYTFEEYLEKNDVFWKIVLDKKQLIIEEGRIGENGLSREESLASNRKAYKIAQQKVNNKKQEGFQKAIDKRLSLTLRQEFSDFLQQTPQSLSLSFFDVRETRERKGNLFQEGKTLNSYEQIVYSCGVVFHINSENISTQDFKSVFYNNGFDISNLHPKTEYMGKKLLYKEVLDSTKQTLTEESYEYFQASEDVYKLSWELHKSSLYEASVTFKNGKKLFLNKHVQDIETVIIPLLLEILKK